MTERMNNSMEPNEQPKKSQKGKRVGTYASAALAATLALGVSDEGQDMVIPEAKANPFEEAAQDDDRGEDDWKEARDEAMETKERADEMEERADEMEERADEMEERADEMEERADMREEEVKQLQKERLEYVNNMIDLVNQVGVNFDGELEEKRNYVLEVGTKEELDQEQYDRLNNYLEDIKTYIENNH